MRQICKNVFDTILDNLEAGDITNAIKIDSILNNLRNLF